MSSRVEAMAIWFGKVVRRERNWKQATWGIYTLWNGVRETKGECSLDESYGVVLTEEGV